MDRNFLLGNSHVHTTVWMHHMDAEKLWRQLHKNTASCNEKIVEAAFHKSAAVRPPVSHLLKKSR